MPKELLVMRHAKSSWDDSSRTDFQRPLNERGIRDAPKMAALLIQHQLRPDLIASSPALRAKQTAEIVLENCPSNETQFQLVEEFYLAPARIYLNYLTRIIDPTIRRVMVVGHNPGLEELLNRLSGRYDAMPTAAIAQLSFPDDDWKSISLETCQFHFLWRPKEVLT